MPWFKVDDRMSTHPAALRVENLRTLCRHCNSKKGARV